MTCIDQLHATHANSVLRHLLMLTSCDRARAEDMLHETMLRARRHVETLPVHETDQRHCLPTVARRIVIDSARCAPSGPPNCRSSMWTGLQGWRTRPTRRWPEPRPGTPGAGSAGPHREVLAELDGRAYR
jgi:hypothetical protein